MIAFDPLKVTLLAGDLRPAQLGRLASVQARSRNRQSRRPQAGADGAGGGGRSVAGLSGGV